MQIVAVMTLLLATAMGAGHNAAKQECSCTQHEPAYPFTIDCDNAAPIRAATLTLESDACESPRSDDFEWGGTFDTPADSYTWVSQAATADDSAASNFSYADPTMKIVAFAMDATDVTALFDKAAAANTLMTGACPAANTGSTITPTTAGVCRTLTFPDSSVSLVDFHATIATTGIAHVAFFTEHGPTEFERSEIESMHYFMSTDLQTDIEPIAQSKEYCKIDVDANGFMACQQAFYVIQAHHDYCPHDTLTRYEETLFHEWESKCDGCLIRRKYNPAVNMCPTVDCNDHFVAELGYNLLLDNCVKADSSYPFEWAANFDTPADSYTWVSQAATPDTSDPSGFSYADPEMKIVAFALTGNQKSVLFGLQDAADTLMTTGTCPELNMDSGTPTITPTTSGACYTLKFPSSRVVAAPRLDDLHANVATAGVAHVAFFTAHVPIEFERDIHYLMSTDLQTPNEPVETLGASGGHDHGGRRLSVSTKSSIGKRHRRLASPGTCCTVVGSQGATMPAQQGAWELVVAYHDLCEHDDVPKYIEDGFHDYETSCENYFCNLVGPGVDQTVCPYPPPQSPPPPPPPPPPPLSPSPTFPPTGDNGIPGGAIAGIIVACAAAALLLIGLFVIITREQAGKPMFMSLNTSTTTYQTNAAPNGKGGADGNVA